MDRLMSVKALLGAVLFSFMFGSSASAFTVTEVNQFGEISGGQTHVDPRSGQGTSKNGYHLMLTAFADVLTEEWAWQLGGGFFYNRIYSDGEKDLPGSSPTTVRQQKNLRIETRAGEVEFASRYRLGKGWEAGLLARALFGASLSFSQQKKDQATKFFIGPQIVFRLVEDSEWLQRVDLSLTTDTNVPQKRVYLLTAGFALGKGEKRPLPAPAPQPVAPAAPAPEDRYEEIFADKVINFATSKSEVEGAAKAFLIDLGQYLKANPNLWQGLEVEGHTDKKGKLAYNMKLSKDRAASVRKTLIGEGANASLIKSEGYGPTRPLKEGETPEILAANRRVVMVFNIKGRDNRNTLSSKIKELRKKHFNED